jgi:ATP-binding cassette subfamily C (CFTR/MRP) protein 4
VTIILLTGISDYLQYFLKQIITVESIMVSSERAMFITKLTPEAELRTKYDESIVELNDEIKSDGEVETLWPMIADIMMNNFSLRYRSDLPLVLKNIDIKINSGQRIGIVGRTGAGKSSIINALFRLTEPEPESKYYISDYDALRLGLHTIRKHISVIPQTPFLFKGTVR